MKKFTDPWQYIDHFPPWFVRLLARRRTGRGKKQVVALSDEEIAITAGIPVAVVRATYQLRSWDGVPVGEMRKFLVGCQFDPLDFHDRNRAKAYCGSSPTFGYLKRSPHWQTVFLPLINRMRPKFNA